MAEIIFRTTRELNWLLLSIWLIRFGQKELGLVDWGIILLLSACCFTLSPSRFFLHSW